MLSNEELDLKNTIKANINQLPASESIKKRKLLFITGSDDAGKTKGFNSSQLTHIQTLTNDEIEINSWYDNQSCFIEVPEKILQAPSLLKVFIKQVKSQKQLQALSDLIVCLNIFTAMQQAPKPFVQYLKKFAGFITMLCGFYPKQRLPLHFMFTHMDKVAGFCHSFDDVKGPWGYIFKPYINHASLLKQNSNNNEILLKNLHSELLLKLHDTQDKLTRYLIREFPLQMESIGNLVNACVNHLSISQTQASGVYFTCALQSNSAHDRLTSNISDTYQLSLKNQVPQSSLENAYFVDGMIEQICTQKVVESSRTPLINKKYAASCLSLIAFAVGTHHFITHKSMNTAFSELTAYQNSQKDSFDELLPALEHLSNANQSLNNMHGTLSLKNLNSLSKQINQQYKDGLNQTFLPKLANQISEVLNQSKSPKETYFALKAYLMLGDPSHTNPNYLKQWFSKFWDTHHLPNKQKFTKLLDEALSPPFKGTQVDLGLVQSSKSYLQALPSSFLYFQLIESELPNKHAKIPLNHFSQAELDVPEYYTKNKVKQIYQNLLPKLSQNFQNDAFVLDKNAEPLLTLFRQAYLDNYHAFWQQLTKKASPVNFDNYQTASKQFYDLSTANSSIEKLFKQIQENTRAFANPQNQVETLFNQRIASHFTSTSLMSMSQIAMLRPLFADMAHYFQTLNQSSDKPKTAFEISRKRFEQVEDDPISRLVAIQQQLPAPLNAWVKQLAGNAWSSLLQDTQSHINQQWQNIVYQQYNQHISGHFPFSNDENNEVSAPTFSQFFSHKGTLNQFFEEYLSPFVDTTTAQWHPKVKDDLQLPISKQTMKELIRANIIKEMFFKYNQKEPSVRFTLHALSLEPVIQDFTIEMNGQKLTETQDNKRSLEFLWPGNTLDNRTQMTIHSVSGEQVSKTEDGYWSWFKLIKKANLEPYGDDMTNFQLTVDINGVTSKFLMITGTQMNPFIPGLLEHFNLPDKIA